MFRLSAFRRAAATVVQESRLVGVVCREVARSSATSPSICPNLPRASSGLRSGAACLTELRTATSGTSAAQAASSLTKRWFTATPSPSKPGALEQAGKVLPGLVLAGCVAQAGFVGADAVGGAIMSAQGLSGPSPISGVSVAIVLGLAINNIVKPPQAMLQPGLKLCTKAILQAGIVCVGAKLSAMEVMKLGAVGVPVVLCSISAGLASVLWINARLGLPARLGALTAAGTSICGVTAITALAPAIQANQQEVAYAVANVVAFGLMGMLAYPVVAHYLLDTSEQVGLFLGTAIHDTAQVMGAGLTYAEMYQDEVALKVAAVTKLMRNLFLAAVIPGLTYWSAKQAAVASGGSAVRVPFTTLFPPFIFGFLAMAALRSAGDATSGFGVLDKGQWKELTSAIGGTASTQFLATAMAAVGLSTNFGIFKTVGMRPFAVGFVGAAIVGITGFSTAVLLGKNVSYELE